MTSSPNRLVATVFGAVYLLVGLAGFLVTGGRARGAPSPSAGALS